MTIAESSMTGDQAMHWRGLFVGCVREALLAANGVARIGIQETRAWESALLYVADDGQGNVGVIQFGSFGAVGAVVAREATRQFNLDVAIAHAPNEVQVEVRQLCRLPLLSAQAEVSAVFWTSEGELRGPESWAVAWRSGIDVFHREMLPSAAWQSEAAVYYGADSELVRTVAEMAGRAVVGTPVLELSKAEFGQLIPEGSQYAVEARELLLSDGVFVAPRDSVPS